MTAFPAPLTYASPCLSLAVTYWTSPYPRASDGITFSLICARTFVRMSAWPKNAQSSKKLERPLNLLTHRSESC
jgi:hypothetical protein